jgi:hypothetical protein
MMTRSKTRAAREASGAVRSSGVKQIEDQIERVQRVCADLTEILGKLLVGRREEHISAYRALAVYIDHNLSNIRESVKIGMIWDHMRRYIRIAYMDPLVDSLPKSKRDNLKSLLRRVWRKINRVYDEIGKTWTR